MWKLKQINLLSEKIILTLVYPQMNPSGTRISRRHLIRIFKSLGILVLFVTNLSIAESQEDTYVQKDLSWIVDIISQKVDTNYTSSEDIALWKTYLLKSHPSVKTLKRYFNNASKEFGVPVQLLMAIGYVENNWTQIGPSIDRGWGIMHLVDNEYCNTLIQGADLIGVSPDHLKNNPLDNIRAAAALLSEYKAEEETSDTSINSWFYAASRFSGLISEELKETQAKRYFEILKYGITSTTVWDESFTLPINLDIDISSYLVYYYTDQVFSTDYSPALTDLITCNFTSGRTHSIDTWVNHWVGTGTYAGAISWFHNCTAQASSHFVIQSSDGEITQVVRVANTAWHCGATGYAYNNSRSIGVEHEATAANPGLWNSTAMLKASAKMAKYFCNLNSIPKTRTMPGIQGHNEMPGTSTSCPGSLPWTNWMFILTQVPPTLSSPSNGATGVTIPVSFDWSTSPGTPEYRIQVSTSSSGWTAESGFTSTTNTSSSIPVNYNSGSTSSYSWTSGSAGSYSGPSNNTNYYWTVKFFDSNTQSSSDYSSVRSFTTAAGITNYTISTSSSPGAGGTTSGGGSYPSGSSKTVTASANSGYTFSNWTENGSQVSTSSSYTFTLTSNRTLVANFLQQTGTCNTCPTYDYSILPSTTWNTHSSSIGLSGCKIYRFPVAPSLTYNFKTGCGDGATGNFDTQLYLFDNNCNQLAFDDDGCTPNLSTISWTCNYTAAGYIYLKVKGYSAEFGSYTLAYNKICNVPAQPTAISGSTNVCEGNSVTYSISPVYAADNYTWSHPWSGSSTSNSISIYFTPNSGSLSVTANNGCGASAPTTLAINLSPVPVQPGAISGSAAPCQNGGNNYSISAVAGATSYTWTLPSGWSGSSTTSSITGTPSTSGGTISVTANNSCGASTPRTLSVGITLIPSQPGAISGSATVCQGASQTYSITAVSGASNYTWTLPSGWSGSSTSTSITVTPGSSGGTISVVANGSCGTSPARTLAVTLSQPPTQANAGSDQSLCQSVNATLSGNSPLVGTGQWTQFNGPTAVIQNPLSSFTTVSLPAGNAEYTFQWTISNQPCPSSSDMITILNSTMPSVYAGPDAQLCNASTYQLQATIQNIGIGTWSVISGPSASFSNIHDPQAIVTLTGGPGTYNLQWEIINGTCAPDQDIIMIQNNPVPAQPGIISGSAMVCQGNTLTYSIASVPGATYYTWVLPSGWIGSSTSNSISVNTGSLAGNISVTANNSCGASNSSSLAVSMGAVPAQPGTITGSTSVCQNVTQTYSIAAVSGATSYTWILPSGWSGSSTSTSISVTTGPSGGNISVAAVNACGAGTPRILAVSINSSLAQPGNISGSANVCQGTSQTYSISAVSGASSYLWTLPSGWSGSSTSTTINTTAGTAGGNISVAASNTCGNGPASSLSVTVNSIPAQPGVISGTNPACQGTAENYTIGSVSGATSYTWTLPSGWSGSSTNNTIATTVGASAGNISITANNLCGNSTARTLAVTVKTPSIAPTSASATPAVITSGQSSVLAIIGGTLGTGAVVKWYTGSCGGTLAGTGSSITVTPTATTTYYARMEGDCNNTTCVNTIVTIGTTSQDVILLNAGWNLISLDVVPTVNTPASVFAAIIANNNLESVTGYQNQAGVFFDPLQLPFLNTLTAISAGQGYWVKVTNACTLTVTGTPVPANFSVNLQTGWNLIGYWPSQMTTPETAFASLISAGILEVVTSYFQGGQFFDPAGLPFMNTLTQMNNSRGYWVNLNGNFQNFAFSSTQWSCGSPFIDTRDNQSYNTVQIGTQCWMKQNLNIGIMIPNSLGSTNNNLVEKYCYNNDPVNCSIYGGLYQWDEMMNYSLSGIGIQGICPSGWHIPSDNDWSILVSHLGGDAIAGGKMKKAGTDYWEAPNTGATDESGFSGYPAGYKNWQPNFADLHFYAYFWSSQEFAPYDVWSRRLEYNNSGVGNYWGNWYSYKDEGFSVRCLRTD
jgi:uncharacterized protein (TIGR02145 family)